MTPARASAPLHITGFFEPVFHRNWRRTGSTGAGIALLPGVETSIHPSRRTRILLDSTSSRAPTTRAVVEALAPRPVEVRTRLGAPMGAGLGTSGAGALSAARALNRAFGLRLSSAEELAAAHRAEVENRTGLGTVLGQFHGGLAIRTRPGLPPAGAVRAVPTRGRIAWVAMGPLPTPEILVDRARVRAIQAEGRRALRGLLRRPTLAEFFRLSRRFTLRTGLADGQIFDAMEAAKAAGGVASMAMLGRTVFAPSTPAVRRALSEFGPVHVSRIAPIQSIVARAGSAHEGGTREAQQVQRIRRPRGKQRL